MRFTMTILILLILALAALEAAAVRLAPAAGPIDAGPKVPVTSLH